MKELVDIIETLCYTAIVLGGLYFAYKRLN